MEIESFNKDLASAIEAKDAEKVLAVMTSANEAIEATDKAEDAKALHAVVAEGKEAVLAMNEAETVAKESTDAVAEVSGLIKARKDAEQVSADTNKAVKAIATVETPAPVAVEDADAKAEADYQEHCALFFKAVKGTPLTSAEQDKFARFNTDQSNAVDGDTPATHGYLIPKRTTAPRQDTVTNALWERFTVEPVSIVEDVTIPVITGDLDGAWGSETDGDKDANADSSEPSSAEMVLRLKNYATKPIKLTRGVLNSSNQALAMGVVTKSIDNATLTERVNGVLNGTGSANNQPNGVIPALVAGSRVTDTASATDVTFTELSDMRKSINENFEKESNVYVMHPDTYIELQNKDLATSKDVFTTTQTGETMIYGRRVITSASMPRHTSGKVGVLYGDLSYVQVLDGTFGNRVNVYQSGDSNHQYGEVKVSGIIDMDSVLLDVRALTGLAGA